MEIPCVYNGSGIANNISDVNEVITVYWRKEPIILRTANTTNRYERTLSCSAPYYLRSWDDDSNTNGALKIQTSRLRMGDCTSHRTSRICCTPGSSGPIMTAQDVLTIPSDVYFRISNNARTDLVSMDDVIALFVWTLFMLRINMGSA